jgi:hypothetical protein
MLGSFGPSDAWLTANVTFSATALTVVANERSFGMLSGAQQRILRTAAARAARRAAAVMLKDREAGMVSGYCDKGRVVLAAPADVAAFEQVTRPVYDQLERDPQVKATIAAIRELERSTPRDPVPTVPASCSRVASVAHARERDPGFLDGTYRWRITRAGALKAGGRADDPVIGTIAGITLRHGGWAFEETDGARERGTFKVIGDRIAFAWPQQGYTNTFTFRRRGDGTLDLTPVLPMDVGDRVVMSSAPWTRVGPPVRDVP